MLKPGRYVAEHDDGYFSRYRIVMEVKETEKSYIFKLVEYDNRYGYDHIKTMFSGKERKTIRKDKPSCHAMRVWGDDDFTIYPFQAGIPCGTPMSQQKKPFNPIWIGRSSALSRFIRIPKLFAPGQSMTAL